MEMDTKSVLTLGVNNNNELVIKNNIDDLNDHDDIPVLMLMIYTLDSLKLTLHDKIAEIEEDDDEDEF